MPSPEKIIAAVLQVSWEHFLTRHICSTENLPFFVKISKTWSLAEIQKKTGLKDLKTCWVWFFFVSMYPALTISFLVGSFNVNITFFTYLWGMCLNFAYCFCKKWAFFHLTSKFWGIHSFWIGLKLWFPDSTFNLLSNDI